MEGPEPARQLHIKQPGVQPLPTELTGSPEHQLHDTCHARGFTQISVLRLCSPEGRTLLPTARELRFEGISPLAPDTGVLNVRHFNIMVATSRSGFSYDTHHTGPVYKSCLSHSSGSAHSDSSAVGLFPRTPQQGLLQALWFQAICQTGYGVQGMCAPRLAYLL